jgi:uncharacterized protein YjbI with pentapeptide repeats
MKLLAMAALLALPAVVPATPAWAGCSDVAGPGVEWRRCRLDGENLSGVDLSNAGLRDTSFTRANLSGARLTGADMRRARLVSANLTGAVLDGANLTTADLTSANLEGASLKEASLRRTRFYDANLKGADLTGALLSEADLLRADLSGARWIDGKTICAEGSRGACRAGGSPSPAPQG